MLCKACGSPEHFSLKCPSKREVINALFEELIEKSDVDDEVPLDHEKKTMCKTLRKALILSIR
jgi:hypothetical protein